MNFNDFHCFCYKFYTKNREKNPVSCAGSLRKTRNFPKFPEKKVEKRRFLAFLTHGGIWRFVHAFLRSINTKKKNKKSHTCAAGVSRKTRNLHFRKSRFLTFSAQNPRKHVFSKCVSGVLHRLLP